MRIRFRASDYGLVAKINITGVKYASCAEMVLVSFVFARAIQELGFRTHKTQANVDYCYVRHRAEGTLLGPGLKHLSLRSDSSLTAKRRDKALHMVFLQQSIRAQHDELLVCVLSYDTQPRNTHAGHSFLLVL